MTIASTLRKMSVESLAEKVGDKTIYECPLPRAGSLGEDYLAKVVQVFIENLPEDESDIKVHVKHRQDERWGVDVDSLAPYTAANTAISLGLIKWGYTPAKGEKITAASILIQQLKDYTRLLVDVLCEEAIEAYENPDAQYVAHINVPGYMPMADEPAEFETTAEAWEYLADERRRSEDWDEDGEDDGSATLHRLVANMRMSESAAVCDVVYGPTPGYDGDHDLGLAYSVVPVQD